MNPKKFLHKTTFSVQLPYIAGHSLIRKLVFCRKKRLSTSCQSNVHSTCVVTLELTYTVPFVIKISIKSRILNLALIAVSKHQTTLSSLKLLMRS